MKATTVRRGIVLAGVLLLTSHALADTIEIQATRDNTLYQSNSGLLSNGAGQHMFAGKTFFGELRRALIAFDIVNTVPAGATIDSVSLTLFMSKTVSSANPTALHRVLQDWGEAGSDAPLEEGTGTAAENGDATWLHTMFPGLFWVSAGGDFDATASASIVIAGEGFYAWSSSELTADVQQWLDDQRSNHGWIVIGNETGGGSAKRFDTRENPDESVRPVLTVEFTPVAVPATSMVGSLIMVALLSVLGWVVFRSRQRPSPAG